MARPILSDLRKFQLNQTVDSELEMRFGGLDLDGFTSQMAPFESVVEEVATQSVFQYLESREQTFTALSTDSFIVHSQRFLLKMARKVRKPVLIAMIFADDHPAEDPVVEIPVPGWGFYTAIHLSVTEQLGNHELAIQEILKAVYISAYSWLEESLLGHLEELENQAANALYACLRKAFRTIEAEELSDLIRFGVASKGILFYLVDRRASVSIINAVRNRKFWSESSPVASLLELLGYRLPYEDSFSRDAVVKEQPEDFVLPTAAYGNESPEYLRTEREMVGGNEITVFPICTNDDLKLVANFTTTRKDRIIPVLEAYTAQLSKIYEHHSDRIVKYTRAIKSRFPGVQWNAAADLLGSTLGGLVKSLSQG